MVPVPSSVPGKTLGRTIHGPMPTNFHGHWSMQIFPENKAARDWSIWILAEIRMDQWLLKSESSGLHRHQTIGKGPKGIPGKGIGKIHTEKALKCPENTLKIP